MGTVVSGNHPATQVPTPQPTPRVFLWVFLPIAFVVIIVSAVMFDVERRTRESAKASAEVPGTHAAASSLISFEPDDVTVNNRWTLLAGHHPTVTFTCRLSPTLNPPKAVILCFRPAGATKWESVETHPRRDRTCRITLRDLRRDMPYECFFLTYGDTLLHSNIVAFRTM